MRLAHLSDIHYLARMNVPGRRFMNKRVTGYLNLKFLRSFQHDSGLLDHLLAALDDARPDHVAVTGDLTNLSLGVEFAELRLLLRRLGLPSRCITVVPGNHDRYTGGSDRANRVSAYLHPYMSCDLSTDGRFPLVRLREGVAILGMDSALSRPPFIASGRVGREQLLKLTDLLGRERLRGAYPVLLLHHPPYSWTRNPVALRLNGLSDAMLLHRALHGRSALILHGHLHRNMYRMGSVAGGTLHVVGVSSATRHGRLGPHLLSTFHIFEVDDQGVHSVQRYTLEPTGDAYSVSEIPEEDFLPLWLTPPETSESA